MRVLHVIPSISPKDGGTTVALSLMARSLVCAGVEVDVATTDDDGPGCRMDVPLSQRVEGDGYGVFYFRKQTEFYKVSWPLSRWLARRVANYDLVHVHALFSHTSNSAARHAHARHVPCVITPHGVLNSYGMRCRRRIVKELSFRFVEQPLVRNAAAMHYGSRLEQVETEQLGVVAPAAMIPLGIDLQAFAQASGAERLVNQYPQVLGRTLVLFLSRIVADKGLDLLLPAFAEVKRKCPHAMLVIAGKGDETLTKSLHTEAERLGLAADIIWPGFLSGADKCSAFAAASVFVLPSYSESFGIALVEAMASGLPCLTTEGVAASADIRERDAGLVVSAEAGQLAQALSRLLEDAQLRARLGANARRLANERFSSETMGRALKKLYEDILAAHRKQ